MKSFYKWILLVGLVLSFQYGTLIWAADPHPPPIAKISASDKAEIRRVIQGQLDAFMQDDGKTAFSFASPGIQARFRTPETFMSMVKNQYFPLYRPQFVVFEQLDQIEGVLVQVVKVVAPDGKIFKAFYPMERQVDQSWKTAGCYLIATKSTAL